MSHRECFKSGGTLDVNLAHLPFKSALRIVASRAWLEIDLDAVKTNIETIQRISGEGVEILLPVKADGYGHGAVEVAGEAMRCGVSWFGVASLEEAIILRREGIEGNILLLTPPIDTELELLVTASITPVVSELEIAARLNELATREGIVFPVHIEVDTGMGRTGIAWREALEFIKKVTAFSNLNIEGIYSHFSSADEEDESYTGLQLERFKGLMSVIMEELISPKYTHMSNSAAAIRIPDMGLKMIRPGLFIYGVSPFRSGHEGTPVLPVSAMTFRTRIAYVKEIERGDPVGYGRAFVASQKMKIATVAVGYRDGLPYGLSNRGEVLIEGKKCPIVGNICMDMLMIDVSGLKDINLGDRVTILGEDGGERIDAEEVAGNAGTISYDVITNLGNKVPRIYYRGGKPVKITSFLGTWEASRKDRD
jgi:alanine racemase